MKHSYLTVKDMFCGAGGSSQGVRRLSRKMGGGLELKLAMNHWKLAVETHNTNFPEADHDCADVSASDPRRYQSTDILIASPECSNHSLAKGKKRSYQQTANLFGEITIDPSAERSRATMWDIPRFAEYHRYNLIIVENVVEARCWVMWDAWLHAMRNLDYLHKCVYLNSMHNLPTPQSRDRMYVVFWKRGNPEPDLNYTPKAYCHKCAKEVDSIQSWKNSRKKYGKYRQQYVYRCPHCTNQVEPYYYSAFNVIDWSVSSEKIGNRNKPLAANTMKRINYGLQKYQDSSFVVYLDHSKAGNLSSGIFDALNTQTTAQVAAIVTKGGYKGGLTSISSPEFTMTTQHNFGVINFPTLIKNYGGNFDAKHAAIPVNAPLSTVTTNDHHGVLNTPIIIENRGQSLARTLECPLSTITSKTTHGLLSDDSIDAFLSYYYGTSQASHISEAMGTVTTKDKISLVLKPSHEIDINECSYRMLKTHEIQAAMAFEDDYIVCGTGKDQVRQLGNAVTPPTMEFLLERGLQTFA